MTCEADILRDIAERIGRLRMDRHDPERFFVERSELAHDLNRIARDLEGRTRVPEAIR